MKLFLLVLLLIGCEWTSKEKPVPIPEPKAKPEIKKEEKKKETKSDQKEEKEERSSGWIADKTPSEESKGRLKIPPIGSKASPDSVNKYEPKDCEDTDLSEVEVNLCNYINSKIKEKR